MESQAGKGITEMSNNNQKWKFGGEGTPTDTAKEDR